jgi:hypothetical protein
MADSCLNFAKQETERLDKEIEVQQEKIRLHNQTKEAWDTIVRNAAGESKAAYLEIAASESARANNDIEAVQQEIRNHTETKDAWAAVMRSSGNEKRIHQAIPYVKGEDGPWHQQRLDTEIEALQATIRVHNETKDAWGKIVRSVVGESKAACTELADSETAKLNSEIEAVQKEIGRRIETRKAWDTIMRNAVCESRIFQGAKYLRGLDGQWHLEPVEASASNEKGDMGSTDDASSTANSVGQALLNVCERTLRTPRGRRNIQTHVKAQFQGLGL